MKKILVLILALALVLTGCQKEKEPSAYPVSVRGEEFAKRPQKVLCLSPASEELMKVLGYGHVVIDSENAFSNIDYPKADEIFLLEPDFIIGSSEERKSLVEKIKNKGINYIEMPFFKDDEEMLSFWQDMAEIFEDEKGRSLRKDQLSYYFYAEKTGLENEGTELIEDAFGEDTSLLFITDKNYAVTPDTAEGQFISSCGFDNLAKGFKNYYVPFNELPSQPEIVVYPEGKEYLLDYFPEALAVPFNLERLKHQSPSLFTFRRELIEEITGENIEIEDTFMPIPEEEPEEESFFDKIAFWKK